MILIRQTSLQLPSVEDVSKISMRCVKKQFEFARQKEIESRRIRAEQEQQQHEGAEGNENENETQEVINQRFAQAVADGNDQLALQLLLRTSDSVQQSFSSAVNKHDS